MPELPEVETVRRQLAKRLEGARIADVTVWRTDKESPKGEGFSYVLRGRTVAAIERRGKLLLWRLDDGSALAVHLKMTGKLIFSDDEPAPARHERVLFAFERDGRRCFLRWSDVRRFGYLRHLADAAAIGRALAGYGPEPLATEPEALAAALARRTARSVKAMLLDQSVIAGVGNIYADEACFSAGIHPGRKAASLSAGERLALARAVRDVLERSVRAKGTSAHTYVDTEGKKGGFVKLLRVYGRNGEPCVRCGTSIKKCVLAGRGTHVCPTCQPLRIREIGLD